MVSKPNHVILVLEPENYSDEALNVFKTCGEVLEWDAKQSDRARATVLVVRLGFKIDSDFIGLFPRLEFIVSPTTGLDHIDLKRCRQLGVQVLSLSDSKDELGKITSSAELTLGLILDLTRRITAGHNSVVYQDLWDRDRFPTRQISGLSLGIVGYGRIGKRLAGYSTRIFRTVFVNDIDPRAGDFHQDGVTPVSFPQLLENSDVVAICANAVEGREPIIGELEISQMKQGAFLVNSARDSLVCERAIAEAIQIHHLGGYACDVLNGEPFNQKAISDNLIWKLASSGEHNVLVTPHLGGSAFDAMRQTELITAKALQRVLSRGRPSA